MALRRGAVIALSAILVTGMSGTGKSSALAGLRKRGFEVVDTDEPGWTDWSDEEGGCVWREERIAEVLARTREVPLFVSGTVSNQGRFYPQFDAVVLLSAPLQVLLQRIATRTTNDYGKNDEERSSSSNTSPRSSRCYEQPARTRSTRANRSRTSLQNLSR
jgi:dephospho-CoA kinase